MNAPATTPSSRRRPLLTITAGPLSSGKSAWVRSFRSAPTEPLCLVRDEVRALTGGADYLDGPVIPDVEEAVTQSIHQQALAALQAGRNVFVDGCHNHPLTRRQWEALATENSADFRLMFFNRSLDEIAALNASRAVPHSRSKIESSFHQWSEQFTKLSKSARPQHHFINSQKPHS